jgi:hypothetical protein
MNDELSLPDVARFSGASQRLAEGQTAEEWLRLSTGYEDPSVMPTIDIGDQQGFIDADGTAVPSGITPGSVASGGVMYDVVSWSTVAATTSTWMGSSIDRRSRRCSLA